MSNLVAIGADLNDMGAVTRANVGGPSQQWRAQTRARLIAAIERDGMGATEILHEPTVTLPKRRQPAPPRPGRRRVRARGAVLVGLAVGTLALSGMSAASGSAMPGDALYGIKRSQEGAQVALATSDVGKGQLYLEFAGTRLDEAMAIFNRPHLLATTLADMDHQTRLGVSLLASDAAAHHSQSSLDQINNFVKAQSADLDALTNLVRGNPAEYTEVQRSKLVVGRAGIRSADIHNVLGCKPFPLLTTDEYGPDPASSCARAGTSGRHR